MTDEFHDWRTEVRAAYVPHLRRIWLCEGERVRFLAPERAASIINALRGCPIGGTPDTCSAGTCRECDNGSNEYMDGILSNGRGSP